MVALFIGLLSLIHIMRESMKDPKIKALGLIVFALLLFGTVFFHFIEGWSFLDSLYFSVITLATVGYGDLTPHTIIGKLFGFVSPPLIYFPLIGIIVFTYICMTEVVKKIFYKNHLLLLIV